MNVPLRTRRFIYPLVLASAALFLAVEVSSFLRVFPGREREPKVVFIKPHLPPGLIALELRNQGVLTSRWKFKLLVHLLGVGRKLKPGEYNFPVPSSPLEAVRTLVAGKVILHKVLFPEGITVDGMGHVLAEAGLVDTQSFEELTHRSDLPARFGIPAGSLKGFLFPDTYFLSKLDDGEAILRTVYERFKAVITPQDHLRARELRLSLLQWVTLASLIEKESSLTSEQPMISSVFHNRLKKWMRLQSDPTVIYGIPDFNGNLTKKDLQTPTPYNTYTKMGLPPGPIANPGLSALRAAIYPATTNFLYFVARKDGTHAFAATYEEHLKNVARYQLGKPASPMPPPSSETKSLQQKDRTPPLP
ncbi:MAG: endolytic transglycosylase MltG [Pseudomonadota bacterium]